MIIRRGARSRFVGPTFVAAEATDVPRLADVTGTRVRPLPESIGGVGVDLVDSSGLHVRVVADTHQLEALPTQEPLVLNVGDELRRVNATQRPLREPAKVQRLGHVVLQTTKYLETLNWYLDHLGLIVSDFLYYEGQRQRGPTMSFIRCDRGSVPADHHTLAMALGPSNRYVHSAYQVSDFDALAAGGEYLLREGFQRSWGIGRHIQGSQIFDYWRDPDGFLVEHFTDGDMFETRSRPVGTDDDVRACPVGSTGHQGLLRDDARPRVDQRAASHRASPAQRQRVRPRAPARPTEGGGVMSTSVLRTAAGWWVPTGSDRAARVGTPDGAIELGLQRATVRYQR